MRRATMSAAVLAVSVLMSGLAVLGGRQPDDTARPERPGRRSDRPSFLDRLVNELALTDEQMAKAKELEAQHREKARAAGKDETGRREATVWFRAEVRKILTEDQAKKYDRMFRRRRSGFAARWKGQLGLTEEQVGKITALEPELKKVLAQGGARSMEGRAALERFQNERILPILTEEQRLKYKKLVEEIRNRFSKLGGLRRMDWALRNLDLTPKQREQITGLRKTREDKVMAAFDAFEAGLKAVLTPEQFAKFEQDLKQHQRPGKRSGGRRKGPVPE